MSPSQALNNDIFRTYLVIIIVILAATGAALSILTWGLRKDVGPIWRIYRSWLVMASVILGFIFLGRVVILIGFMVLSLVGFKEYARSTGLYRDWWMTGGVYAGIVCITILLLMPDPKTGMPGWYGMFMTLPVYVIALLLLIPILRNKTRGQLQSVSLSIVGFMYIGWMFGHLGLLANSNNPYGYLLYILLAVELNDVAAFTFGKLFGRHPLRSEISPKKTWEGALGALGVSLLLPWLLGFSFPELSAFHRVLLGLIVGIGGQLGDLSISVIKRDLGIKDMGAVIPGHGGILDRIDSMIYTAPLFLHMIRYFYGIQ